MKNIEQYNEANASIEYIDATPSRWSNVYNILSENDYGIIIGDNKVYIGEISSIKRNKSVNFRNVKVYELSNDDLLRINAIFPELIPRVKANFQPFIHPHTLDIETIVQSITTKNLINFYIVSQELLDKSGGNFLDHDRVIIVDKNKIIIDIKEFLGGNFSILTPPVSLNVKGKTLDEINDINKSVKRKSLKSNNVKRIHDIIEAINKDSLYKFSSFFSYHDTLFNKRVYNNFKNQYSNVKEIYINNSESIYKVSMSPKDTEFSDESYDYF